MTSPKRSILVIDDEDSICLAFKRFFEDRGWGVSTAASANEGLAAWKEQHPNVVFLDVRLPDRSGLELLEELAADDADVVVITAYGGLDTVVRALQSKACDYLDKPIDLDKALALANRITETRSLQPGRAPGDSPSREILVGKSPAMQETYKLIARAASTSLPVLIEGETGTGKELAAHAIHQFSNRHDRPFVTVNCGAIPTNLIESELFGHVRGAFTGADGERAGRFESADRGTLLLDEVGELPFSAQVKLLRVLDNATIERVGSSRSIQLDVRIVAATNRDLSNEVRNGRFREDLFYRLAVLQIAMPPLRTRGSDIELLARHFLTRQAWPDRPPSLGPDVPETLARHPWPGNVRELKNAMEHALAAAPGRAITPDDLPDYLLAEPAPGRHDEDRLRTAVIESLRQPLESDGGRFQRVIQQAERAMIEYALTRHGGKQSEASEYLGLHRNTLRNKLRDLGLK